MDHNATGGNSLSAVGPAAFTKVGTSEILGSEMKPFVEALNSSVN